MGYRCGYRAARCLPAWAVDPASAAIGTGAARIARRRRLVVERNLARAMGMEPGSRAPQQAASRAFAFYVRYWIESFRLPAVPGPDLARHMTAEGFEHIEEALAAGNGAILALPHLGSWDYAGAWMASIGYPMTVVVEPLEPPELFDWFADLRRRLGMTVVPLGAGAAPAVVRALRSNRVVGLLCDRDLTGQGVDVELMGERTTLPAGPATIALRTGAALLPTGVFTLPAGQHHSVVLAPVSLERSGTLRDDVARVTQDLAVGLQHLIRRAPEQWHMFQPNWPSDLPDSPGDGTANPATVLP